MPGAASGGGSDGNGNVARHVLRRDSGRLGSGRSPVEPFDSTRVPNGGGMSRTPRAIEPIVSDEL
jgi:hypothetical protein